MRVIYGTRGSHCTGRPHDGTTCHWPPWHRQRTRGARGLINRKRGADESKRSIVHEQEICCRILILVASAHRSPVGTYRHKHSSSAHNTAMHLPTPPQAYEACTQLTGSSGATELTQCTPGGRRSARTLNPPAGPQHPPRPGSMQWSLPALHPQTQI